MSSFTKTYHAKPYHAISPTRPELSAGGKVVLVTGAGSGIGAATAIAFAEASPKAVILCGRRVEALGKTKAVIRAKCPHVEAIPHVLDITSEDSVTALFRYITATVGPVDIVANAAGHLSDGSKIVDSTLANFWDAFEVQVKGTFLMAQHFLRNHGQQDPTFISFSSVLAHIPATAVETAPASYGPSKTAQSKLVEWIAKENAGKIRCYSVHPGVVETDMSLRSIEMTSDPVAFKAALPWDDINLPAHFCVWLASSEGACIPTGKFLWINWDVEELKAKAEDIAANPMSLTLTLDRWPFPSPETIHSNTSSKGSFWTEEPKTPVEEVTTADPAVADFAPTETLMPQDASAVTPSKKGPIVEEPVDALPVDSPMRGQKGISFGGFSDGDTNYQD